MEQSKNMNIFTGTHDITAGPYIHKGTETNTYKNYIGIFVIYIIVMIIVPYYLYKYTPFSVFLTYFANVDIVANIFAITYPSYFSNIYNIDPNTIWKYISYNLISVVALSGIFIHGIHEKTKNQRSNMSIYLSMVFMTIITWVLPTKTIPYIISKIVHFIQIITLNPVPFLVSGFSSKIDNKLSTSRVATSTIENVSYYVEKFALLYYKHEHYYRMIISTVVAVSFIILEGFIIHNFISINSSPNKAFGPI